MDAVKLPVSYTVIPVCHMSDSPGMESGPRRVRHWWWVWWWGARLVCFQFETSAPTSPSLWRTLTWEDGSTSPLHKNNKTTLSLCRKQADHWIAPTIIKFNFVVLDGEHSFLAHGVHFIVTVLHPLVGIYLPKCLVILVTGVNNNTSLCTSFSWGYGMCWASCIRGHIQTILFQNKVIVTFRESGVQWLDIISR